MIRKNSAARTFLCLLLAFVFAASCLPQTIFATTDKKTVTTWPEGPENNSGAVCLLDADTGAVLYDKNMDEQRYPASITKILTALLIIENKQMTDTVTFGEHAVSESIPGNARINVQLGETITVEDALHAILLASANEVCTQLAIDIAGSEEGFAAMKTTRRCTWLHEYPFCQCKRSARSEPLHQCTRYGTHYAGVHQKRDLLPHRVRS